MTFDLYRFTDFIFSDILHNMDHHSNTSDLHPGEHFTEQDDIHLELYSIVLSVTMLVLAILFGGGGCVTVLIAIALRRLLRKLRYILLGILLIICSAYDFIWCPVEISRLLLQQNVVSGNTVSLDAIRNLKYISSTLYVLLLCALACMIMLICVQNLLKIIMKYEGIPKLKLGIIFLLIWLVISVALTIGYVLTTLSEDQPNVYHNLNKKAFHFKLAVQVVWIILVLVFLSLTAFTHYRTNYWKNHLNKETSDLHSNENFTVPSLIIKSVEEMEDDENEESSIALPSPDIQKDPGNESPVSRSSKSAMKKRSGSPSSQKVLFADTPSPTHKGPSPQFGERLKSQNHLEVNMAAILGRRRHTIAQISDPQFDMMQKAKTYNYVRKFSVDISALQAQLENPKIHNSFPFHSQQDIKNAEKDGSNKKINAFGSQPKCNKRSRDEIIKSQEIAEEPEHELEDEDDEDAENGKAEINETQSVHSQCASVRSMHSARDSICPTPPLISLTQSDGEEKQLEVVSCDNNDSYPSSQITAKLDKPCKLSCLLLLTFLLSILPMFITEVLWDLCLTVKAYININTCMIAFSMAQTMIFPQVIFCVDENINKAVHVSFVQARLAILGFLHRKQHVPTNDEISDTEV